MTNLTTTNQNELVVINPRPLDQNPAAVYLASKSLGSRRTLQEALDKIAGLLTGDFNALTCNWAALRYQHTAAVRSALAEMYKPATVNKMLSALRGVIKAAWRLGQMTAEDYQRAVDIENVIGDTLLAGRHLSSGEIAALMSVCEKDPTPAGTRDAAIVAVLYTCGLRREEIVKLILADFDPQTGQLVVHGKRSRDRFAYVINGAARAMTDWLTIRGDDGEAVFCAINKAGRLDTSKNLTPQAIYNLLDKRAEQAGMADFSPHDFRRTFVSDLLDAGADIATIAKMAGHASVQTTARYDRRPEEAKIKAAGLLHVPYHGK